MVTIVSLSRGKCGLSKGVKRYLVDIAAADQLVVLFNLLLGMILMTYMPVELLLWSLRVSMCNIQAALLFANTNCSVWFTVTFTFNRFFSICFQKLKRKYCTGRAAALVLGTVILLSYLKNIFWYLSLHGTHTLIMSTEVCMRHFSYSRSQETTFLMIPSFLTPIFPFVLILLLNSLTIRHVFVASRVRRNLHGSRDGETPADPEMKNRRQSLLLLLVMSGNFILLWALLTVCSVWESLFFNVGSIPPNSLLELGYALQLPSCCINMALYAVVQARFRAQQKEAVKSPFSLMAKLIRRCRDILLPQ
ncbi:probable G-protein coupled receptor 139 [Hypanus sabinus]|uniref:probable G-protein coupled receptor 139 n=1 Tax=Hypanus sabinus TaxID=79690 RepID=UPI0028C3B2FC|nr:probable G-protein coupled receptor 139 [Hypanus sabinus]